VAAVAGEGDGDGVDGAFDEGGGGAGGERGAAFVEAEQLRALGEQVSVGGVEVLGARLAGRAIGGVVGGVAAGDEAVDVSVGAVDGEDEPVPELVDEPPGGGDAAEAGGEDFLVGDAVPA
jgi:hypothetical protein